jgi:hypothetical protein
MASVRAVSAPAPSAGWYADPQDPSRWRWWDGAKWTDNVSDSGRALWSADYLVVRASAKLAQWRATVHDRTLAQIGSVTMDGTRMRLLDTQGALQLTSHGGSPYSWDHIGGLRTWTIADRRDQRVGELAVTAYFNRRLQVALRTAEGQELAQLAPIGKTDADFAITDAAGAQLGRVWRAERDRSLLAEDETWAAQIARPLSQPLDTLVLAAVTTLDSMQHVVQSSRATRSNF